MTYAKAKEAGRINELPVNHSRTVRAGYPSDVGDGHRDLGRCGAGLAFGREAQRPE